MDDPKVDGLAVLERVSGIPRDEIRTIAAQVRANHTRLDACKGPHAFVPAPGAPEGLRRLHVCRKCAGTITDGLRWYLLGLAHGAAHPEEAKQILEP